MTDGSNYQTSVPCVKSCTLSAKYEKRTKAWQCTFWYYHGTLHFSLSIVINERQCTTMYYTWYTQQLNKKHFFQEQHKIGGIMPGLGFGWRELAWSVHFTPDNFLLLALSSSFFMKFFFSHKWLYLIWPNIYFKYFSKMFTWIVCKNIMFALVQGFWEIRLKERTTNKRLKSISFI